MKENEVIKIFKKIGKKKGLVEDIPHSHLTRFSSVIVPICFPNSEWKSKKIDILRWRVLFTIRSLNLKEHAGEISFPGGKIEEGEESLSAALRECKEEIGIKQDLFLTYFKLNPSFSRSGFHIVPYCGLIANEFCKTKNSFEVSEVFFLTIKEILEIKSWSEVRSLGKLKREIWHFPFYLKNHGEIDIWGTTGNILKDLILRIE